MNRLIDFKGLQGLNRLIDFKGLHLIDFNGLQALSEPLPRIYLSFRLFAFLAPSGLYIAR